MSESKKAKNIAVAITIEMKDGSKLVSLDAAHADEVWQYLEGCQMISAIHGSEFRGKPLERVEAEDRLV